MKKSLVAVLLTAISAGAFAEFVVNPDANTLWKEDGKAIVAKPGKSHLSWMSDKLEIKSAPNGGFTVEANNPKDYTTLRYVPMNKDYPYLVYRITGVEEKKGYVGYSMSYTGVPGSTVGQVRNTGKGIFAVKLFEKYPFPNRKSLAFRIDLYGQKITFDYIKQVKEPENYVFAESAAFAEKKSFSKGDKIKFTVKLADGCEDVTVRLYNPYLLQLLHLNGQDKIQLKPTDDTGKIWSAEVEVKDLKGSLKSSASILLKATVLGSETIKEPLWGTCYYLYK